MFWIIFLIVCSLALSLVFTPLMRQLALHCNCGVDQPDSGRKIHKVPIPRIGGVPILLAYAGALGALVLASNTFPHPHHFAWKLVSASLLVFITGLADDLLGLKPWQKLLCEILAGVLAYLGGIQIQTIGSYHVPYLLALPLTVVWLVGCTNAFNLIDGLDGLAAGIGLLAAVASLVAGLVNGNIGLVVATAPLVGALLGFLYFNFNPASIFLGDGGSLWVGFLLACFSVIWSNKSITVVSVTAPLMVLSLPILDTMLSVVRRFLRGQPIFRADRGHIHHRLMERGLSVRRAVLLLYGVTALGACCSLLQSAANLRVRLLVIALFGVFVWNGIRYLAYQELGVIAVLLRRRAVRSMVQCHLRLCSYEALLGQASTVDECWGAVKTIRKDFEFSKVELNMCGHHYEEAFRPSAGGCWILQIPLSDTEYVRFMCQYEFTSAGPVILPLTDLLHRTLSHKLSLFCQEASLDRDTIEVEPHLGHPRVEIL